MESEHERRSFLETGDPHCLGRPADFDHRIVRRRLTLVNHIPNFTGTDLTLLDIGCGNGASMFGLSKQMKYCLGLDITDEHLDEFNEFKAREGAGNCECQIIDIENSDPPGQFDRIISFEVIEHLKSEDGVKFFFKALRPGGLMAVSVPNKWWLFETHGAKLPLLPWNRIPFFSWLPRQIHERYSLARIYTKSRIIKLLESHGFSVLSAAYITAPLDVLPNGTLKDLLIRFFFNSETTSIPFKSTSIMVVARRP